MCGVPPTLACKRSQNVRPLCVRRAILHLRGLIVHSPRPVCWPLSRGKCYCGKGDPGDTYNLHGQLQDIDCSMPCAGNAAEACGGHTIMSVYAFDLDTGKREPCPYFPPSARTQGSGIAHYRIEETFVPTRPSFRHGFRLPANSFLEV